MSETRKRLMVVDDEVSFTRLLKLNLERAGEYEVCVVNSPGEAIEQARRFRPDLILLDVMMPEMDGGTLAGRLNETPSLESVPIIFLTAAVRREEIELRRGQIGGYPFIAKPVDLKELEACLRVRLSPEAPPAESP
jgi:CheY-like chemotaxis protein